MSDWTQAYFDDIYRRLFLETVDPARTKYQVKQLFTLCPVLPGSSILDVGCGLGRHSLEMARLGFRVTGIDMNAGYVEMCRASAAELGVNAEFVASDSRVMDLGFQADLVVSLWSSFGYYGDKEDAGILERFALHVKPRGHVIIDVENRDYIVRHFVPEEWHEAQGWTVLERRRFNAIRGTVTTRRTVIGHDFRKEYQRVLRMYTAAELCTKLSDAGLNTMNIFGDYNGSRFGLESRRMIIIAER